MVRTRAQQVVRTLLAVFLGLLLVRTNATRSAHEAAGPANTPAARSPAIASHGEDDDQPAGACWLARTDGAAPSCLCSAGTVEDLMTPDFMRLMLAAWHDAGRLTTGELRARLDEVDFACAPGRMTP